MDVTAVSHSRPDCPHYDTHYTAVARIILQLDSTTYGQVGEGHLSKGHPRHP